MGLLDGFFNLVYEIKYKVEEAFDWVKEKFSKQDYDEYCVEDHVDVDAVLAEFRAKIDGDLCAAERQHMATIILLFSELEAMTEDKFPDLVEIIKKEQKNAEKALEGTIMKYVKEHLSKNDPRFLNVLKMSPGQAKTVALNSAFRKVLEEAEDKFNSKLKKHTEFVLSEFKRRLNIRLADQEKQLNSKIEETKKLQQEVEVGKIDMKALEDSCTPVLESAQCILHTLRMEM